LDDLPEQEALAPQLLKDFEYFPDIMRRADRADSHLGPPDIIGGDIVENAPKIVEDLRRGKVNL
jgi:hypothetical protein